MKKPTEPPAELTSRPKKYAKLTGLPARIRLDAAPLKTGPAAFELSFSIEEYEVPKEGGEVIAWRRNAP